jgi:hypothetical protein
MEKLLLKIARQLNGLDEASLMALWPKYLSRVQEFDGSREWEEAAIVLSMLQAVRGKNQLFNVRLAEKEVAPATPSPRAEDLRPWRRMDSRTDQERQQDEKATVPHKPATVLQFKPRG